MLPISYISSKFSPEHTLLILISRVYVGTTTPNELNHFIVNSTLNWDKVFFVIRKQKIIPIAYQVLAGIPVDNAFINRLQKENAVLAIHTLTQTKEMIRLYNLIREKGINIVPYKGPVFSQQFYGDISQRQFTDIDFLMPQENYNDLEVVIEVMNAEGYIPMYNAPQGYQDILMKNTCEFYFDKYENSNRKYHIEFHWMVHHPIFDLPITLPNSILLKNTESVTVSHKELEVLNTQNNMLALVMHHGVKENWALLKHILDISQIIQKGKINWNEILTTCKTYGFENALNTGILIAHDLLGIETKQVKTKQIDIAHLINNILGGGKQKHSLLYNQWQKIRILDSNNMRSKMLLKQVQYAFTPSMLDYKAIVLPKSFHFLYFFVKLIRIPITLLRRK